MSTVTPMTVVKTQGGKSRFPQVRVKKTRIKALSGTCARGSKRKNASCPDLTLMVLLDKHEDYGADASAISLKHLPRKESP